VAREGGRMNRSGIIITNNPKVIDDKHIGVEKLFIESDNMLSVLLHVRDMVHEGHKLISHPLSGSLKPNENPFKSVIVSQSKASIDFEQVKIIENCIETCRKFISNRPLPRYKERIVNDYMYVDKTLIESGLRN